MIQVNIKRGADTAIQAFSVLGHAEYGDPGKDIVCAGVSAITVGMVNAIEALLAIEPPAKMKKGLLQVEIPTILDPSKQRELQLLLEAMVVMLESIQASYSKYVTIEQVNKL